MAWSLEFEINNRNLSIYHLSFCQLHHSPRVTNKRARLRVPTKDEHGKEWGEMQPK